MAETISVGNLHDAILIDKQNGQIITVNGSYLIGMTYQPVHQNFQTDSPTLWNIPYEVTLTLKGGVANFTSSPLVSEAHKLALAVLRGDTQAALLLADEVLLTYHNNPSSER